MNWPKRYHCSPLWTLCPYPAMAACQKSSGVVKIVKDLDRSLKDKEVIVVEDIVDSGRT